MGALVLYVCWNIWDKWDMSCTECSASPPAHRIQFHLCLNFYLITWFVVPLGCRAFFPWLYNVFVLMLEGLTAWKMTCIACLTGKVRYRQQGCRFMTAPRYFPIRCQIPGKKSSLVNLCTFHLCWC